jgi:hypothetical protein
MLESIFRPQAEPPAHFSVIVCFALALPLAS